MLQFDLTAFHYLNGIWTNPFFDWLMPIVTTQKNWVPLLIVGWFFLLLGFSGRFRRLALMLALVVTISDVTSSRLIKPIFSRQRPCCSAIEKRLLVGCTKSKSFPSSHAVNSAAVAGFIWLETGWAIGLPLTLLSILIAYSRVYVGVHYPLDVFAGFLIGWAVALLVWNISQKFPGKKSLSEAKSDITGVSPC